MTTIVITLKTRDNVKEFVNLVSKASFDIDVRSGRYCVDAKSVLGMYMLFNLNKSKPLTVEIYSDNCQALLNKLAAFSIEAK